MARVGRQDAPEQTRDIELFAAKGEYEPFQVVVSAPEGGLTNVSLKVSDLTGPDGSVISNTNLPLYREHYIFVDKAAPTYDRTDDTNKSLGPGWYADALVPFVDPSTGKAPLDARFKADQISIASGENQPYWIDLFVPRDAEPGQYTGTYTVTCDQGKVTGQIALNVWNFALPLEPSEASLFWVWVDKSREAMAELVRHKIMPCDIKPEDAEYLKSLGLTMTDLHFFSGADMHNHTMKPAPSVEELQAKVSRFPDGVRLLNYTADEIVNVPELNEPLKEWGRNLHAAGAEQLFVAPPVPELFDDGSGTGRSAVDIWVIQNLYHEMSPENVMEASNRGMEVWTYTAANQDGYSPKWLADFEPINYRTLQGFLNQSMGFTGVLYWGVDQWRAGNPHTCEVMKDTWVDIAYFCDGDDFAGEGVLVYPGKDAGVQGIVPSMRLKWIRKGIEDYEYIELLKRAGHGELAIELSKSVAKDFHTWSQDPAVYEKVRHEIADILSK